MKPIPFTAAERRQMRDLADAGVSFPEIARRYRITRSAAAGIVFRDRKGFVPKATASADHVSPHHRMQDLAPAKHPFAPDCSEPDFAHDELHVGAVRAARDTGFPVMPRLAR